MQVNSSKHYFLSRSIFFQIGIVYSNTILKDLLYIGLHTGIFDPAWFKAAFLDGARDQTAL